MDEIAEKLCNLQIQEERQLNELAIIQNKRSVILQEKRNKADDDTGNHQRNMAWIISSIVKRALPCQTRPLKT